MNTAYKRGSDFERRAKARLEASGCVVFRTAGSRSPVDLISFQHVGLARSVPHFIQCKSGRTKISRRERMELIDLAVDCGAIPVLCTRGLVFEVLSGEAQAA